MAHTKIWTKPSKSALSPMQFISNQLQTNSRVVWGRGHVRPNKQAEGDHRKVIVILGWHLITLIFSLSCSQINTVYTEKFSYLILSHLDIFTRSVCSDEASKQAHQTGYSHTNSLRDSFSFSLSHIPLRQTPKQQDCYFKQSTKWPALKSRPLLWPGKPIHAELLSIVQRW